MKLLFVVNPIAGGNNQDETIETLQEKVRRHAVRAHFYMTTGERDEDQITEVINTYRPDRIIAAGGDGTIQLVARLVLPFDIPLAILPLGSANGLATALALPQDLDEAFDRIVMAAAPRPFDMLRINEQYLCIHLADIGVNALLVKKYEEAGQRGLIGYARHFLSAIQETPAFRVSVETEDKKFQQEGVMMAFANAHKYGTGVQISKGSVFDGKFEIINVEAVTLDEAIKAGLTALNVFVDDNMYADVITCRRAEVAIDRKIHFQIDGEYIGMVDRLAIEIVPGALKMFV